MHADQPPSAARRRNTPRPRRVTLAQVAERAAVSIATASFVLAGRTDQRITEETQARVRAAAEHLRYRPNTAAKTLRTGRSGTIAFISEFVASTPYATASITGALQAALKQDTLMFIAETLGDPDIERRLLQSMIDRRVDGFIYAAMFTRQVSVPKLLLDGPLVLLNCISDDVAAPMILPDEHTAAVTTARTLLDAGHRDGIYYVGAVPAPWHGAPQWRNYSGMAVTERLHDVREELKRAGTSLTDAPPVEDWEAADGRRSVTELLSTGSTPRAIICANDRLAFGVYQALHTAGLRIPQDVSMISFDDSRIAADLQPGLTSIALPYEEMGRIAAEVLMSGNNEPTKILVPMPLKTRGSIAAPRNTESPAVL
jgi:LacI family transcriptional regulator